jgi:type I restriction enzyme S subunit
MERYDSYKDSGVEWLGEIPSHWNTPHIKNLVETKITDGPHLTPKFIDEGGIPFLSVESIQNSKIDLSRRRGNISVEDHIDYSKKCKPQWNDILLVKSASVGKLTIVDIEDEFNIWSPLSLIRIKKYGNPRYFYYFFHTDYFQTLLKLNSGINTQPNIGMGVIENLKVVSPPLSEQNVIVSFLDTKTSQIDSLIEKTQRKIELLKEKRTSLINEVVTKGLNPNVGMKNSGVDWIGEIPSHWELRKGSTIGNYSKGNGIKKDEVKETGLPCIRYGEIYTKYNHKFERVKTFIDEGITDVKVSSGTLFMTGSGELLEEIGKCVVYVGKEELYVGGDIIILKPFSEFDSEFLSYQINSECIRIQRELNGRGGIIVHIYSKNFKDMWFPTPSLSEQNQIVSYLDEHTQLIDKTISVEERRIDTLKEYRQSLISEVVTGKIDVRVN